MENLSLKEYHRDLRDWGAWIALFVLPLAFYPKVIASEWMSNSDIHSLLEFWAASIALTAAGLVLLHFFATGKKMFLLISLAFTLQGTEDLIHALYLFSRIWPAADYLRIESFAPGTHIAGRVVFAVCLFVALFFEKDVTPEEKRKKDAIVFNTLGMIGAAIATYVLINTKLPRLILQDQLISRPADLAVALIYIIVFFSFIRFYRKPENRTPLVWSMIASIILSVIVQAYLIHSQRMYDAQFNVAHIAKIASYLFPIWGIGLGIFSMYKEQESLTQSLRRSIQREKKLAADVVVAEIQKQKAQELEKALGIAEQSKNRFEQAKGDAEKKARELEKMNKFMFGRERRMVELKEEIAELKEELSRRKDQSQEHDG